MWARWTHNDFRAIETADAVRPSAARAVEALYKSGIRVVMPTGDNQAAAPRVAAASRIDTVNTEVLPRDTAPEPIPQPVRAVALSLPEGPRWRRSAGTRRRRSRRRLPEAVPLNSGVDSMLRTDLRAVEVRWPTGLRRS